MIHNSKETALVWRRVADSLPQLWGIVAPDLHLALATALKNAKQPNLADAMQQVIKKDLAALGITEAVVLVAAGDAAIVALDYYWRNPQQVRAIFLTEPVFEVSAWQGRLAKMKANFSGKQRKRTVADVSQEANYLTALTYLGAHSLPEHNSGDGNLRVPVRILVAEKEHSIAQKVQLLADCNENIEYFSISGAEAGWNDYAPGQYAANIVEFVEQIETDADKQ